MLIAAGAYLLPLIFLAFLIFTALVMCEFSLVPALVSAAAERTELTRFL